VAPTDPLAQALFDFVGRVAQGTSIEELQSRYLDGINDFIPSSAAGLYVLNPFTRGTESIAARGVSDFFLSRYEEYGRQEDPVLQRILAAGRSADSGQLMPVDAWTRLPVYGQVFGLHRMTHLLEAPLIVDDTIHGTLNFGRNDSEAPFTAQERALADSIARLLAVTLSSVRVRTSLQRERDQIVAALELCGDAMVVTDLRTATRRMNGSARKLLARLREGELGLDDLLVQPVRVGEAVRHETVVVQVDGSTGLLCARSMQAGDDRSVMVTFLELIASANEQRVSPITDRGLTPREQQVAELAANGLRDCEIAQQLFLSPYTVKQYLKGVYRKLGVRSRVDLARLAVQPTLMPEPDEPADGPSGEGPSTSAPSRAWTPAGDRICLGGPVDEAARAARGDRNRRR
jgi:DNA-binding CsgD family transcriptional regulator